MAFQPVWPAVLMVAELLTGSMLPWLVVAAACRAALVIQERRKEAYVMEPYPFIANPPDLESDVLYAIDRGARGIDRRRGQTGESRRTRASGAGRSVASSRPTDEGPSFELTWTLGPDGLEYEGPPARSMPPIPVHNAARRRS